MEGNKQKSRQGKAARGGKDRGQGVSSMDSLTLEALKGRKNPAPSQAPGESEEAMVPWEQLHFASETVSCCTLFPFLLLFKLRYSWFRASRYFQVTTQ